MKVKKMKMMMRGRKERRMKEKMTNGTLMDSNLPFLIFSSPWEQVVALFFHPSSCAHLPCFLKSPFSPFIPWFSTYLGGNTLSRIQQEKNLYPFLFQIHFYSFLSQQKLYGINTTVLCGTKKTFCSLSSAGSWRVLGPCVVVHRILAFFLLSLYIGLRDYTVSLCEYGHLTFTNIIICVLSLV